MKHLESNSAKNDMYRKWLSQTTINDEDRIQRLAEVAIFNIAVFVGLALSKELGSANIMTIIAFQAYFSYNIIFHLSYEIKKMKTVKLKHLEDI